MSLQPRRKPHCRTCGSPMAGHKRQYCFPNDAASAPGSPHPSYSTGPARSPYPDSKRLSEPSFSIPEHGPWHRRNPNWVDPSPFRLPSRTSSMAPTVIVDDDGNTVAGSVASFDDDDGQTDESRSVESSVQALGRTAISKFKIKRLDDHGDPTYVVYSRHKAYPSAVAPSTSRVPKRKEGVTREDSFWATLTPYENVAMPVADLQRRDMPGALTGVAEHTWMDTFIRVMLIFASGSLFTWYMLSVL